MSDKINAGMTTRLVFYLAAVVACDGGAAQVRGCCNDHHAFERSGQTLAVSSTSMAVPNRSTNEVFAPIGMMGAPLSTNSSRTEAPIWNYGSSLIELPAQLPSPRGYLISTNQSRLQPIAAGRELRPMQSGGQLCFQKRTFNSYSFEFESGEFCD